MKRPRGLVPRVLAASLVGTLVAGVLMFFSATRTAATIAIERSYALNEPLRELRSAECVADPEHWGSAARSHRTYAYDTSTGRSANPDAPPLDPDLLDELASSPDAVATSIPFLATSGQMVGHFGPPGPCGLIGSSWTSPPNTRRRGALMLLLGQLVVLALAGALTIFAAIRPLLRRIDALARSAEHVGNAEDFTPIEAPGTDALGRVAQELAHSHQRIVEGRRSLRQRSRALQEHLDNVAHDVRTPLAALQLRLEALLTEETARTPRERLTASIDDVVYLTQLTENLRLVSRLEHGLLTSEVPRAHDLAQILRRVVGRFTTLGELRGVKVRGSWPDDPVPTVCHPAAAEQALANLAHNAVLHAHGEVTLALDRTDEGFELMVVDDGPGVAPQSLPRLADRHFREDRARSRGPRGSGLGLAIVSEVCQRFDWTLEFEVLDPPGLGVTIRGTDQSQA